jgi:hypothetical protein
MTQDEIIEMARQANLFGIYADEAIDSVTRFANLVAQHERERIDKEFPIKFASQEAWKGHAQWISSVERKACEQICIDHGCMGLAAAIRERSQA